MNDPQIAVRPRLFPMGLVLMALMASIALNACEEPPVVAPVADDGTILGPKDGDASASETLDDVDVSDAELPGPDDGGETEEVAPEVSEPDAEPDAEIVEPEDVPCVKSCEGKVCGPDGCGGICGYCTFPSVCGAEYTCIEVCEKQCDGKFCGPDGCGGNCGECEDPLECGEDGLCYEPLCEPDCSGKVCGPDGCGADCGNCIGSKVCLGGGCTLGPCGTVTSEGECQGTTLLWCEDKVVLKEDDCSAYPGYTCAYDPWDNKFTCVELGECVPQCEDKQCGSDGCEGDCGACTTGWACEVGECVAKVGADCGSEAVGFCDGTDLWYCGAGKLGIVDCTEFGEKCGWVAADSEFGCK